MRGYIPYGYGSETQIADFGGKQIDPLDALNEAEKNGEISICRKISDKYCEALAAGTNYEPTESEIAEAAAKAKLPFSF